MTQTAFEKKELEGILGKDTLTVYDAGRLLEHAGKLLADIPQSMASLGEQGLRDAKSLLESAGEIIARAKALQSELEKAEEELCVRYDRLWNETVKRRAELSRKLADLEAKDPIPVPSAYQLGEMLKLAASLAELSEPAFSRLVELAKAMR